MLRVCVGYDAREHEAYDVTVDSLLRHATERVKVTKIDMQAVRDAGLYTRPYRVDEAGRMWDERDGRPFSVGFSFTRFLVPWLVPPGPALFVDCDFVFKRDVAELFKLFDYNRAVQLVKHVHQPPDGVKMDGALQASYKRKNWSSCVLWNTSHPSHEALTTADVNHKPGLWLHGFGWLADHEIGELPEAWNWLAGASPTTGGRLRDVAAVHYTGGGPWFPHMQDSPMAGDWLAARDAMKGKAAVVEESETPLPQAPKIKRPYVRRKAA